MPSGHAARTILQQTSRSAHHFKKRGRLGAATHGDLADFVELEAVAGGLRRRAGDEKRGAEIFVLGFDPGRRVDDVAVDGIAAPAAAADAAGDDGP